MKCSGRGCFLRREGAAPPPEEEELAVVSEAGEIAKNLSDE
jgi:hypothetical protein